MAGTILISGRIGVALNTFGYQSIIEAVRAELDEKDASVTSAIYDSNDVACMNFISLVEQDVAGFRTFLKAAQTAFKKAALEDRTIAEWHELMVKLSTDPRG